MVRTVYGSSELSGHDSELEMFNNTKNELFIRIYKTNDNFDNNFICFDLETAIKFSKELRKYIAIIKDINESEVNNG